MRSLPVIMALLGPAKEPAEPSESEPTVESSDPAPPGDPIEPSEPTEPPGDVEARADALVRQGKLDEAFALLEQAYYEQERPEPRLLFGMGVIELERGNCEAAVGYLGRFLATDPAPKAGKRAREVIAYCEAKLRERGEGESESVQVEAPPIEEEPTPEPVATEPSEPGTPATKDDRSGAWYRDGLAWGLVGTGVAVSAVGVGLLVRARSDVRAAEGSTDEATFDQNLERVDGLRIAGGVLTGVGAALLVGGAVRYGVVARRQRRSSVAVGLGSGWARVSLRVRF